MTNQPPDVHPDDPVSVASPTHLSWPARVDSPAFRLRAVCIVLFCGTLLLFSRAVDHSFHDCDDPDYVTQNAHVQAGLTWAGVRWAFTSGAAANRFPLTWLRDESWLPAWDWPAVQQTVSLAKAGAVVGHNFLLKQRGRLTFLSETMGMLFACLRAIK